MERKGTNGRKQFGEMEKDRQGALCNVRVTVLRNTYMSDRQDFPIIMKVFRGNGQLFTHRVKAQIYTGWSFVKKAF